MMNLKSSAYLAGLLLVGSAFAITGCTTGEEGDVTPSPSPAPGEPVALAFDAEDIEVLCDGTTADTSSWTVNLYNDGQATEEAAFEPYVYMFDAYSTWTEDHTLTLDFSYSDETGTYVVMQDWTRSLEGVATLGELDADPTNRTIFQCQEREAYTYIVCATDMLDYNEVCVGIGPDAEAECAGIGGCDSYDPNAL